ncbi:MAG: ATP-binding protein [Luteolibacter sp.]
MEKRLPAVEVDDEIGQLTGVINDMLDRLEKGLRQAERFASDASHELRTPLTIMKGEIDGLLARPDLPHGIEEKLVSQQEEISRLDRITERLLLLARFDAGAYVPARQQIDFSELVKEACEDMELLTSSRDLTMEVDIHPALHLQGDSILLRRVVLNLLDNAAKFNIPSGSLACRLEQEQGVARLTVSNTGPGIPDEEREKIFERFYRTDAARVRAGYGLGLSLCREIVRAHGGDIRLENPPHGRLTNFIVTLPADLPSGAFV